MRFNIRQFSIYLTPLALLGCALLGPNYTKPKVDTPKSWSESANNTYTPESNTVALDSWWKQFSDKTLNNLVSTALENNNDIQTAIGNITIASGNLQQIKMGWVPTISLGGTYGYGQSFNSSNSTSNPALNSFSNMVSMPNTENNFSFYNFGLMPSYSLNIFQQIKRTTVAKENLALAKANKDAIRLIVISQVVGSYFTILALNEEIFQQTQLINNLESIVKLANIQYKYGLITQNNLNNYEQKLSQAKMQLPTLLHNKTITINALSVLVNQNPNQINIRNRFEQISLKNKIPLNLPSSVLSNRPDIKIAEYQLKIANDNIGVATSNFFPHIYLTTPIGGYNMQLANLFNANGDFWAAQIAATMPILNLGLYGLIKQSKGQYYIAYYNYIKTVRQAFADVNNSLSGIENTQNSYTQAQNLYNYAQKNAKLEQENYKNGYVSYPESLSSQINYNNSAILYIQTKLTQLQSIITLYQSIAAGYNYNNTNTPKSFGDNHDA